MFSQYAGSIRMMRLSRHIRHVRTVYRLHGFRAVFGLYLSKIPVLENIWEKLLGPFYVRTKILGSVMYLNTADYGLHRKLLLKGIREEGHVAQVRQAIKPGMVGIELGANIGYYALLEAGLVGDRGKIFCIEPEPGNLHLLKKHIDENNYSDRMETFQYLIGDSNGIGKLHIAQFANTHSVSRTRGKQQYIQVPMVTIDSFIQQQNRTPEDINFLRMDIEGYEAVAFAGMESLFRTRTPFHLLIEFHPSYYPEWGWDFQSVLEYLASFGFRIQSVAYEREYDHTGNRRQVMLKNPSIRELLAFQSRATGDGSQAWLTK